MFSKDCLLFEYPRCYVKHLLQVGLDVFQKHLFGKGKKALEGK